MPVFANEPFAHKPTETGWLIGGQTDVLVQVKHLNIGPVNVAASGQCVKKLELRCSGGSNNPRMPSLRESLLKHGFRAVCRGHSPVKYLSSKIFVIMCKARRAISSRTYSLTRRWGAVID